MKEKKFITQHITLLEMQAHQRRGRLHGYALRGHINSAHGGKEDPDCPACKEIKEKEIKAKLKTGNKA